MSQSSQAPQPAAEERRVIVHHLSDLHYEAGTPSKQESKFVKYRGYLDALADDQRPELVIVTGDLTASGSEQELKSVASFLRGCFPQWQGNLHEHVVVVPGPQDIGWKFPERPDLREFERIFADFARPSRTPPQFQAPVPGTTGSAAVPLVVAYPIDTCFNISDLRVSLKTQFASYAKSYKHFVQRLRFYGQLKYNPLARLTWFVGHLGRTQRREYVRKLRVEFLTLSDKKQPQSLHSGQVRESAVQTFTAWAQPLSNATYPAFEPLKILVTHHPITGEPDVAGTSQQSFVNLAREARSAGFHLALHGHIHKPQVLSDLSIVGGSNVQHPMRQIGAASMGEESVFNEIQANYRVEKGQGTWHLQLHVIDLEDVSRRDSSPIMLLNPAESADNTVERLTREAERRRQFQTRLSIAMRRFAELVYETHAGQRFERPSGVPLPQDPLLILDAIIREVIYDDSGVRVRLLVKHQDEHRVQPKLKALYLTPPVLEGPESLNYPASIAAWSLVLGRRLQFPLVKENDTTEEDHEWLRRTQKIPILQRALKAEAEASRPLGSKASQRYDDLDKQLAAIQSGSNSTIAGTAIYQQGPSGAQPGTYPSFICIPYPLRPRGGSLPTMHEVAVLDVGVRTPNVKPTHAHIQARNAPTQPAEDIFSEDRVEMLEMIAECIGMILMASSALGKPIGVWDERTRA